MIFKRLISFPKANSFFLFGARGTGKTHLLKERFPGRGILYIDLLDPEQGDLYSLRPKTLVEQLAHAKPRWVIIDEIQKVPKLLDVAQQQIESRGIRFILTGSSARKLKHGGANLLAGRAFIHHLYPLTFRELGREFSLEAALTWGTLPKIYAFKGAGDKRDYLRAYAHTYLREEITQEQVVRRLEPFRRFLAVAAQMSGRIVNFSSIAREAGATVPSVQTYFQILEDTLIGFLLEPFHESVRKRQLGNPKFYFFDTGVQRALHQTLDLALKPQTSDYGTAFEHFVINEIRRLAEYSKKDWGFSYLCTKDGVEIDLILERPGRKRALIEIKSSERVDESTVRSLAKISRDIPAGEAYCLSRDPVARKIGPVRCFFWERGIEELGL